MFQLPFCHQQKCACSSVLSKSSSTISLSSFRMGRSLLQARLEKTRPRKGGIETRWVRWADGGLTCIGFQKCTWRACCPQ